LQKIAQMKLRNFLKDMPPEHRMRGNKRDVGELFNPEWQQIDRLIDEQKESGGRVCRRVEKRGEKRGGGKREERREGREKRGEKRGEGKER
jgi:hypothetical protein